MDNGRRTGRRRIEKLNLGKSTNNPNQRQDDRLGKRTGVGDWYQTGWGPVSGG